MSIAPPSSHGLLRLAAGPVSAVLVTLIPLPGLEPAAQATAGIAIWMAIWWMTEAVPIPVTSLLPLVAFPVTGVLSYQEAAAPYANHLIFLFMGGFFIAKTMERSGLHRRIALRIVVAVGTEPRRLVLGVMLATALLSMWIPNTAVAVMMLPIGMALIGEFRRQTDREVNHVNVENDQDVTTASPTDDSTKLPGAPDSGIEELSVALMLGIAYAASIGGVATLIGTPPNLVFASMAEELVGEQIDFIAWMGVGLPISAFLLPAAWYYLTHIACAVPKKGSLGRDFMHQQLRALGRMSRSETAAATIFGITAIALVLRSEKQIGDLVIPGLQTFFPMVGDATIVMAAAIVAFCVPLSLRKLEFALDWETGRDIRWGILILFGGGLSLAEAFQSSGLSASIANSVNRFEGAPEWVIVLASTSIIIFLTEMTSNTGTATLLMPLYASIAIGLSIHPYVMMASGALAASMAFMLPVATPPNAIVYGSGMVTIPRMMRVGFVMNIAAIIATMLAAFFLIPRFLVS